MTHSKTKTETIVSPAEIEKQRVYSAKCKDSICIRHKKANPLAYIRTFGCQGNVSDGERLKGMLCEAGYTITETVENADFVLLNTCAIREHAQDRVFGNIGALKHMKESNPEILIALCGCMMQQDYIAEKIKKSYPYVDLVFGTHAVYRLPELIYRSVSGEKQVFELPETDGVIAEGLPQKRDSSFKAWLPVMYGCDNYCSYCVVPYVRGRERSREVHAVLAEAEELVAAGYKEITLLGQNVNSYGKGNDSSTDFSGLLRLINSIPGDFIIRFMTSNPKDCSHKLLDTMADCDKAAKHLHLPFQSGNNRILRAMNRGYTREQYLSVLTYARGVMPDLSVTSDVIVGFPGETYAEFCDTLSLVKHANFTSLFTFIFSPRKGTAAASLPDLIAHEEKVKWFRELTDLQEKNAAARTAAMTGKTYKVLCEKQTEQGSGIISGRTESNIIIEFPAGPEVIGSFQPVKVNETMTWMVKGEIVNNMRNAEHVTKQPD